MEYSNKKLAIVQLISHNAGMMPINLLEGIALLEKNEIDFSFYDLEQSKIEDLEIALNQLFSSIKEEMVIVALSSQNLYLHVSNLPFLFTHLEFLYKKKVFICSAYLSFFNTNAIKTSNITIIKENLTVFLSTFFKLKKLRNEEYFKYLSKVIEKFNYSKYMLWSFLTFGCNSNCKFCYNKKRKNTDKVLSYNNIDSLIRMMRFAQEIGMTRFKLADPNFLTDKGYVSKFLLAFKKSNLKIKWRCKTRLDHMDQGLYERMVDAQCERIFFGLEHTSPKILEKIDHKTYVLNHFFNFLKYWKNLVPLDISFIVGFKQETVQETRKLLTFIKEIGEIKDIHSNLGYYILFNKRNSPYLKSNYFIFLLYLMLVIPHHKCISKSYLSKLISLMNQNSFFSFFHLTECCGGGLSVLKELIIFLKKNPALSPVMPSLIRVFDWEGGEFTKMLLRSRSVYSFNDELKRNLFK